MKNNTICGCSWCGKETVKAYQLKDKSYLCLTCAVKHYNSVNTRMENHIKLIRQGLYKKRDKLDKFKQMECKHENTVSTGYSVGFGENMKHIWKCPDCNKTIYKKEWSL